MSAARAASLSALWLTWMLVAPSSGAQPVVGAAGHAHPVQGIPSVPDELLSRALAIRNGIGGARDIVTTVSPRAQAFYDQALSYMHGYQWIEAARSLNQALREDKGLGMAHVTLSLVFTELNQPTKARDALARAQALAPTLSAHDRQHLAAREAQVAAEAAPGDSARLGQYRSALDTALAAFPRDVELVLARGIAESSDPADRGQGAVASGIPYFQRALTLAPGHAGAHHYLAHALENDGRMNEAVEHGAAFATAAPSLPHARHMHGHALVRSGRVAEAIDAFEAAHRLEIEYIEREGVRPEYVWHHEHNLDLLAASYRYVGQMTKAGDLLSTAFETPSLLAVQLFNKRQWPEFLISRGRMTEALAAGALLAGHPATLVQATGHVVSARARLASKQYEDAASEANAALRALRAAPDGAALVGPAFEAVQGEFFLRTGQRDKGGAMLRSAVTQVRSAPGPDNWIQALFTIEAIARAARDSGDWALAGWAAQQMLAHDAGYAGTHYALALVAEHNRQTRQAGEAFARAARRWDRADSDLPEGREARRKALGR